ncbi:hypothetical protein [Actinomyces urogenitalis]|uniref:hypothetical protein n=2 Tax=Actinomyces urogenitalis TaxID=103621 RepID=UPI002900D9F8|nr:hypothetical protein [Actinomyces urogenitalis]MDU0863545.1 hypothetical protein [Actinomyces urogenitalis]MDU0873680.1 hypothetical protein [Actinomyces urogenitalis]MDU1563684.1 hypothetical protein [Actinomyces urogenitalis]MDU1639051.1 hypothetical protein [Actinomyces urogenitalis]MDU6150776.1 hypothetical protein [Actinomyces urogenitalis]
MNEQEAFSELRRISSMPYGQARILAAERVVKDIETHQLDRLLPVGLLDLVEAYTFADETMSTLATFARILRLYDSRPELFDAVDTRNLYWEYKWVVNDAIDYPQVTAAQVEALIEDMERRYRLAGLGLGPVRTARFLWASHRGDPEVWQRLQEVKTEPGSQQDDCRACQIGTEVNTLLDAGRYEETIALARTQQWECNQEPWNTRTAMALAAFYAGDDELAVRAYKDALASRDDEPHHNRGESRQIELLASSGHVEEAVHLIREAEHRPTPEPPRPALLRLLHIITGLSAAGDERYEPLRQRSIDKARELAAAFDSRNGTTRYAQMLDAAINTPVSGRHLDFDARARQLLAASSAGEPLPASLDDDGVAGPGGQTPPAPPAQQDEAGLHGDGAGAWAKAEEALGQQDYLRAAYYYQRAALIARDAGFLERAGAAYAEAAQSLNAAGEGLASSLFAKAVPLLRAGQAPADIVAAVLEAWAPVACARGEADAVLTHLRQMLEELARREDQADQTRLRARLQDTLARTLFAQEQDLEEAYKLATQAGEDFAGSGLVKDVAHAFWLAGRIAVALGRDEDAVYALESAFEGFTIARCLTERSQIGEELLALLRSTGRTDRAEELIKAL